MAHVQSTGLVTGNVTSTALTLNGVTAGSVLLTIIRVSTGSDVVVSTADNRSNVWTRLCNILQPSGGIRFYVYKAENVAAGNTTITVTFTGINTARWIVAEYSNVPSASAIDAQLAATFSSTTAPSAPGVAATVAGDTIVAAISSDVGVTSITPGSSYTARQTVDVRLQLQDKSAGPAGNYPSSWVLSPGAAGAYINLALKPKVAAVKWHPGHYVGTYALNSLPSGQIAEVQALPNCVGIGLWYTWRHLETTRGVYNFSALITALDQLHAAGLHAYLLVADTTFGGTTRYAPDYLTTEPNGDGGIWNKSQGQGGTTPMVWNAAIMARVNALFTALGAAIDTHPALEVICYREADPGLPAAEYGPANLDTNGANYMTQLKSWADNTKAAFPHTNIGAPGNFPVRQDNAVDWVEYCYQRGVGIAGPDLFPQPPYTNGGSTHRGPTYTDRVIRGETWNGSAWVSGGFDYRGKIFCANQVQDPDMGRGYTWPPQAFYDFTTHSDGFPQGHIYWWRKDYAWPNIAANLQTYWSNSTLQPNASLRIKPWLQLGAHPMSAAAPTFYGGNIDTT
jgi:hypothetical protein